MKFFTMAKTNTKVTEVMKELSKDIQMGQITIFRSKVVQGILEKLEFNDLISLALKGFTGSVVNPRNPILSELFFFEARKKAETQSQKYLVDFYEAYVVKLVSAQIGDEEGYSTANEKILGLLKEDREGELPGVIYHAIGKEVYKVGLNMIGRNYKKSQNQMMEKAESFFSIAASKQDPNSLYYLGEMYESGNAKGGVNIKKAIECYKSSAALNNPRSFFKLSIFMNENFVMKRDPYLEFSYMKKAAEAGLTEAQHNLGVLYLQGAHSDPNSKTPIVNESKALTWFLKAVKRGYPESCVNAIMILSRGTKCGKIPRSEIAARLVLEKLKMTNSDMNLDQIERMITSNISPKVENPQK